MVTVDTGDLESNDTNYWPDKILPAFFNAKWMVKYILLVEVVSG